MVADALKSWWMGKTTEELRRWHLREMGRVQESHTALVNSMTREAAYQRANDAQERQRLEAQLREEADAHARDIHELQEQMQASTQNHKQEIRAQEATHSQQQQALVERHECDIYNLEEQMRTATQKHEQEIRAKEAIHSQRHRALVEQHEREMQRLRDDLENTNDALVRRDDEAYHGMVFTTPKLPHSPDEEIRQKFTELQQRVEGLSRLEWKQDRTMWPESTIEHLSHNLGPRLLKKAILQDTIWSVLFRAVFCNPFRMFGEEGLKLEQQWSRECGEGASSSSDPLPVPSFKAERWRYLTMKECSEVLQKPRPSHLDPRARVEEGFKRSLHALISRLRGSLEALVVLEAGHVSQIQRLSTHASQIWFEFCLHRCRMRISLNGREALSEAEKAAAAEIGPLELTESPEVGRYGNVKGVDLERFTVISGCEGKTVAVSSRSS